MQKIKSPSCNKLGAVSCLVSTGERVPAPKDFCVYEKHLCFNTKQVACETDECMSIWAKDVRFCHQYDNQPHSSACLWFKWTDVVFFLRRVFFLRMCKNACPCKNIYMQLQLCKYLYYNPNRRNARIKQHHWSDILGKRSTLNFPRCHFRRLVHTPIPINHKQHRQSAGAVLYLGHSDWGWCSPKYPDRFWRRWEGLAIQ